jgi:hypothetical protein
MIAFVRLTDEQRAVRDEKDDRWLDTLRQQAADSSDPETQENARLLLASREKVA